MPANRSYQGTHCRAKAEITSLPSTRNSCSQNELNPWTIYSAFGKQAVAHFLEHRVKDFDWRVVRGIALKMRFRSFGVLIGRFRDEKLRDERLQ